MAATPLLVNPTNSEHLSQAAKRDRDVRRPGPASDFYGRISDSRLEMSRKILVLSGEVGAGKSTLASRLVERYGARRISTHALLTERVGPAVAQERRALQEAGEQLDRRTKGTRVREAVQPIVDGLPPDTFVIIDSIRIRPQLDALRGAYGRELAHLHLKAPLPDLERRYMRRRTRGFQELASYEQVRENSTERQVVDLEKDADIVIDTSRCTPLDVEVRAAAHLGLSSRETGQLVDVRVQVVGG